MDLSGKDTHYSRCKRIRHAIRSQFRICYQMQPHEVASSPLLKILALTVWLGSGGPANVIYCTLANGGALPHGAEKSKQLSFPAFTGRNETKFPRGLKVHIVKRT